MTNRPARAVPEAPAGMARAAPPRWQLALAGAGLLVALTLAGLAAMSRGRDSSTSVEPASPFLVTPRKLAIRLNLQGLIEPGEARLITAPFDGPLTRRLVEFGEPVEAGRLLFILDDQDILMRRRDAEIQWLRAERALADLADIGTQPDVIRARRAVADLQISLAALRRQGEETQRLLARGIIARQEADQVQQQIRQQEQTLAGLEQDVEGLLARASAESLRIARLEQANGRARLAELEAQLAGAEIRAPAAGIVLRPPAATGGGSLPHTLPEPGARLTRGQPLALVADTSRPVVVVQVDETEINRLRPGQTAEITSEAFDLPGLPAEIIAIAAQPLESQGRFPRFEVRLRLAPLAPEQRPRIRPGMSARVSLALEDRDDVLVIPLPALHGLPGTPHVHLIDSAAGPPRAVPVRTGQITPEGVEITAGLVAGQRILLPAGALP